jgi:hypothetical protein
VLPSEPPGVFPSSTAGLGHAVLLLETFVDPQHEEQFNFPAGAGADAGTGSGIRIGPHVLSNRKVNFVLSLGETADYSLGPHGTSARAALNPQGQ